MSSGAFPFYVRCVLYPESEALNLKLELYTSSAKHRRLYKNSGRSRAAQVPPQDPPNLLLLSLSFSTQIIMDNNIHAPTVASGPVSGATPRDLSKLSMPELMQEKERIEAELSALSSVLQSVRFPTRKYLSQFLTNLSISAWGTNDFISYHLRRFPS